MKIPTLAQIQAWLKSEPTTVQAIFQSLLALGVAFSWWHWSPAQTGAVLGMVAVFTALVVRTQVVSLYSLKQLSMAPPVNG